jgi:hypothetical protein
VKTWSVPLVTVVPAVKRVVFPVPLVGFTEPRVVELTVHWYWSDEV